jgi:thiol-disulfide isomerase/thioredoxin
VRPNKLLVETDLARLACDGKTLATAIVPLRAYTEAPAPSAVNFDTIFTGDSVGSSLFGGPGASFMTIVTSLLLGDDPAKAVLELGDSLTLGPDASLDGKPFLSLKLGSTTGPSYVMRIDPDTKLVRAIDMTYDAKALDDVFPAGKAVAIDKFRWTSGAVSTAPAPASAFAFTAPEGFHRVEGLAQVAAGEPEQEKFKVQALVGKPAPEFTLTLLDGDGKTRTVSRADFAGKVVLIDFWATWCGPCLAELPEIQKLVEDLGKAKKAVVVVALSQDTDPKEPAEVRKLIESTLEKKKIDLTSSPAGKVGLDPSNTVGEAFGVEGYPTVVILDAAGVVRAAHVGFNPGVGERLAKELDAVLEGKPIPKEKK